MTLSEEDLIMDDVSIFHRNSGTSKVTLPSAPVELASEALESRHVVRTAPSVRASLPPQSTQTLPAHSSAASSRDAVPERAPVVTMDLWEQQREREMERLDEIRREEEAKQEALRTLELHKTLGEVWVKERSRVEPVRLTNDGKDLMALMSLPLSDAVTKMEGLVKGGLCTEGHLSAAAAVIRHKLLRATEAERPEWQGRFLKLLQESKSTKVLERTKLFLSTQEDFVNQFHALSPQERQALDFRLQQKAVRCLTRAGLWEEAIAVMESQGYSGMKQHSLEMTLLRSSFGLPEADRAQVLAAVRRTSASRAGSASGTLGLLAAKLETKESRYALLKQAAALPSADEATLGALLACSNAKECDEILKEASSRGLSISDPHICRGVLLKICQTNPSEVCHEIDRQRKLCGLRAFHFKSLIRCVTAETADSTIPYFAGLLDALRDDDLRVWAVRKALPKLYDEKLLDSIILLCDRFDAKYLESRLPRGIAFYNEALAHVGRPPITPLTTKDIDYVAVIQSSKTTPVASTVELDLSESTDRLLTFAREKNWAMALELVKNLPAVTSSNSATITLLYNCALSAAVDHTDAVEEIRELMASREVVANTTTVNTVLSSYARAEQVDGALTYYNNAPAAAKDTNTSMILLSLLSKKSMLKELIEVYDGLKANQAKIPSSVFAVVLGATVTHSWETSLQVFTEMVKAHGKNVNEALRGQIFSCLERHGQVAEVKKLTALLESKKKRKRK